ncbi:MAG: cob(I)yrinic acid a,c-diamide adenosyltransferase [bacterium]
MKIYTKAGDGGETSLIGGARVSKAEPRVAAYGDVDELNAVLGLAHSHVHSWAQLRERLEAIQRVLFGIGAELATGVEGRELRGRATEEDVVALEHSIDGMEAELPELTSFILPGGGPAGASLHVARTVCRRAERAVVALGARDVVLRYLNRLSDWLFVAARYVNTRERHPEIPW